MGRKISKDRCIWYLTRYEELHKLHPDMTKKVMAERLDVNYNTFCNMLRADGRCVKRRKVVEHEEV